jgi:Holliday junction resolvase
MSEFERELKGILTGDNGILHKITKTCSTSESSDYMTILINPFIVIRSAGSLGIADLVAIRGDMSFLIEIKSSKAKEIRFSRASGANQKQAEKIVKQCEKTGTLLLYAQRLKGLRGDSWRIFSLDIKGLSGIARLIHNKVPLLRKTRGGIYIMNWDDGMKLSTFIRYLSVLAKPNL